jgi:23S rRNA (adenine2503-C2)-methyltransferase
MPVNDRYPLEDVLAECRKHYEQNNRRVYIEYVMLAGVNDHTKHAKQLAKALTPHEAFKVNLIPYNPTGTGYDGSGRTTISAFKDALQSEGVVATVRLTRGQDIAAACGQLVADAIQKAAVSAEDEVMAVADH